VARSAFNDPTASLMTGTFQMIGSTQLNFRKQGLAFMSHQIRLALS